MTDGGYFEDFEVGDVYRHPLGRTVSETDNTWFTLLTHNTNQMHFNAEYAARSAYGRILVNSGFTIALVLGLSVSDMSQHAIANLGWDDVRLPHPVFVGDTINAESRVVANATVLVVSASRDRDAPDPWPQPGRRDRDPLRAQRPGASS